MRYFTPLLPPVEMRQSKTSSKSPKVSCVKRSSVILGLACAFRQPSSSVQASPAGVFWRGSSHPLMSFPLKSSFHPSDFSAGVSWFSCAVSGPANIRVKSANRFIGLACHIRPLVDQVQVVVREYEIDGSRNHECDDGDPQHRFPRELLALAAQHQGESTKHSHKIQRAHRNGEQHQVEDARSGRNDGGCDDDAEN